jgi:hypothetical protein
MEYKGYSVEGDNTFGYHKVRAVGKGSVHLVLRGSYTTPTEAMLAIDRFLDAQEVKNNVSKKPTSRSK